MARRSRWPDPRFTGLPCVILYVPRLSHSMLPPVTSMTHPSPVGIF